MEKILEGLNKRQREAVESIFGTYLVLAGAGSGKTKVLTTRIANLVYNGANPYSILAVTFTNKAAKEMKERLEKILGEDTVRKIWVGTFHSICGRILRYDIDKYATEENQKWDRNFVIYDETDSMSLIKNSIKKLNLDEKVYAPKLIKTVISNAKNKMQNAYAFATRAKDHKSQRISEVYQDYENQLILNNALDFDDMLLITVNLLKNNDEIREKYFSRFSHILVDEFQDTNPSQYSLIKSIYTNNLTEGELENRSLCVVGDVDQSIYSWRGADFRIILNFQSDFRNTNLIKLEQNYRSVETILEAANAVILNNSQRIDKNLYSSLGRGEKIQRFEAQDESMEANFIASRIQSMKTSDKSWEDFAILYRTNSQSRSIEEALIARGLPYKMVGGLKFYDRKEIKDIVAYLKFIYNTSDSQALRRIINIPKRGIGQATLQKLQSISDQNNISVFDVISSLDNFETFTSAVKLKLENFAIIINDIIQYKNRTKELSDFITYVIEKSGYLQELKEEDTEEAQGRIDNLQELINVSKEFEPIDEDNILGEFLAQIALVSDLDDVENTESITLMTLHSAKGLEFDTVFLAGLDEGIFPHSRSINNNIELEEERRLMYVGITRAKQRLFLTNAKRRQMWGEYRAYNPSRFFNEIPPYLIESKSLVKSSQVNSISYPNNNRSYSQQSKDNYYSSGEKTFKSAIDKIRSTGSFGKDFVFPKTSKTSNTTVIKKSNQESSSSSKNSQVLRTPPKAFVNKSNDSKVLINREERRIAEDKKIQDIIKNSSIKKMLEEKKKADKEHNNVKINQESENKTSSSPFREKDKVFHEKFGVGSIKEIKSIGDINMYIVDFGVQGLKAIDSHYANLKKL